MASTSVANIINPEVLADQVSAKFPSNLLIAGQPGLVKVNTEFAQGTVGTVLTIPHWLRGGSFGTFSEGVAMVPGNLTTARERTQIVRGGYAQQFTDIADLVTIPSIMDEVSTQMARRAAEYVDDQLIGKLNLTPNTVDISAVGAGTITENSVFDAMLKLGDQHRSLLAGGRLIMHSKVYNDLLKLGAVQNNYVSQMDTLRTGMVSSFAGLPIEISDRATVTTVSAVTTYNTYLVGPGALGLFYQKQLEVEIDRDILKKETVIAATIHFAPHLFGWDDVSNALVYEDAKSVMAVKLVTK